MSLMNKSPRLGIIGGAGPMAGALLFQKIIQIGQESYGCQEDSDFPYLMLISYPFSNMLENPSEDQKRQVQQELSYCLNQFIENQAERFVIACNTLHAFLEPGFDQNPRLVHLIRLTSQYLEEHKLVQSVVLCTETSARYRLHQHCFPCSYPEANLQLLLNDLIQTILAGKQSSRDAKQLAMQLNRLKPLNPDKQTGLVLGCTEFSVFNEQFPLSDYGLDPHFVVVDPNQIAAQSICQTLFNPNQGDVS